MVHQSNCDRDDLVNGTKRNQVLPMARIEFNGSNEDTQHGKKILRTYMTHESRRLQSATGTYRWLT